MQADAVQFSTRAAIAAAYALFVIAGIAVDIILVMRLARGQEEWEIRIAALKARAWPMAHVGTLIAILAAAQAFLYLFFAPIICRLAIPIAYSEFAWFFAQGLFFHCAILICVFISARRRGWSLPAALRWFPKPFLRDIGRGAVSYLAAMPLVLSVTLIYYALLQYWEYTVTQQDVAVSLTRVSTPWAMAYAIALAVLIGPAAEELLFRRIILPLLIRRFGLGWAVLLTSVAFAAFHFHVPSFAALTLLGLAFSLAYLHTGSLAVPIVMHALFNGVNLAMLWMSRPGVPAN